jgi:hypothetical protein
LRNILLGLALLCLTACDKNGIPLMGYDDRGKYYEYMVSDKEYAKQVNAIMITANEAVQPALSKTAKASQWRLRTVVVGLGFKGELRTGPSVKKSVSPRLRLAYSNSANPVIP